MLKQINVRLTYYHIFIHLSTIKCNWESIKCNWESDTLDITDGMNIMDIHGIYDIRANSVALLDMYGYGYGGYPKWIS